jgi:predicted MFS family arabinose efflux permease
MNRNFWIIALIAFINALSYTVLIPIIYLYGKQFGLNDFETSLLFAIYSLAQFFATPVIGKLSDRFGRKPLLVISLLGTVIANYMAGIAATAGILFFARFLDGITGGNVSVAQAVISDVTTPATRAKAFGIFGASFGLGFILGPVISLLAQEISLGASFIASAAFAFVGLVITIFFLPETLKEEDRSTGNVFDLGLDKLITGLFIPKIGILLVINFLIGTTFTIFTYAFQPYFLTVLKQTNQTLTLMFLLFGVLGVIMQTSGISILNRKYSVVNILLLGIFVRSLCFLLMPVIPNIIYFVVVAILFASFNSVVQPMISTLITLNAKPEEQGIVIGLNSSYLSISNAIGPILAGVLVNQSNPSTYAYPLYFAGISTFMVLFFAVRNQRKFTPNMS